MKQMVKNGLAWLLVLAIGMTLLTGCGSKNIQQETGTADT